MFLQLGNLFLECCPARDEIHADRRQPAELTEQATGLPETADNKSVC